MTPPHPGNRKPNVVETALRNAIVESIDDSCDLTDLLRDIFQEPDMKAELKKMLINYLHTPEGIEKIIEGMDNEEFFCDIFDNDEMKDLFRDIVKERLK